MREPDSKTLAREAPISLAGYDFRELVQQGLMACERREFVRALHLFRSALRVDPHAVDVHYNIAKVLKELGHPDQAIQAYRKVLELHPSDGSAMYNLANILHQEGLLDEAALWYLRATDAQPESPNTWNNLGMLREQQGDVETAIRLFHHTVALDPQFADGYNNLSSALMKIGMLGEAEEACRQALRLNPTSPEAYNNLGGIRRIVGDLPAAERAYRKALRLRPDLAEAMKNLASTLHAQGRFDEEIEVLRLCLEARPEYADAHLDLGLALLLTGNFEQGWREYEWRLRVNTPSNPLEPLEEPLWDGVSMRGRRLLLRAEQGAGDTIQFIRYVPLLAHHGLTVIVQAPPELEVLLKSVHGVEQVVARGHTLPAFDVHCPLLSLPALLGAAVDTVPNDVPYLFPNPDDVARWRESLLGYGAQLHVGIVWAGNPHHPNDGERSTNLSRFSSLSMPGVQLHGLQLGEPAAEVSSAPADMHLVDHSTEVHDFAGTAALIETLDLVITVDTAVAHLAGALGKTVWTLLPFIPDWRWLTQRNDSPWYPSMRLFRQPTRGDWDSVFRDVRVALEEFLNRPSGNLEHPEHEGSSTDEIDWHALGVLCGQKGDHGGAVEYLHMALQTGSADCQVWNDLGNEFRALDNLDRAIDAYQHAIHLNPGMKEAFFNLGVCFGLRGLHAEAIDAYSRGLDIDPHSVELRFNRGVEFERSKEYEAARRDFEEVLRTPVPPSAAYAGKARALKGLQQWQRAAEAYRDAMAVESPSSALHLEMAQVQLQCGRTGEAEEEIRRALALQPESPDAHNDRGVLIRMKGDLTGAEAAFRKALQCRGDFFEARVNLAEVLMAGGLFDEAHAHLLAARDARPDDAKIHASIADVLLAIGDRDGARRSCETGLYYHPADAGLCTRMGNLCRMLGDVEQARCWYEQALVLDPGDPDAHWNFSQMLLLLGEFEQGWEEYEWRWKHPRFSAGPVGFSQPLWEGKSDIRGKTILLHAEQGFGDTLQFLRYVPMVAKRGATIILGVPPELLRLARCIDGISSVHTLHASLPSFDVHCPLMSLPRSFGTTVETIPAAVPYLTCEESLLRVWEERLRQDAAKYRVGLVWLGSPRHENNRKRNCTLADFSPLAGIDGVSFYSLQKGDTHSAVESPPAGMKFYDYTRDLNDFADTAGLVQNLDLVITVDTAVAHLAGALGKPVWTLLPYAPDWRWMRDRADTPWYPTMRLYRQGNSGGWGHIVHALKRDLEQQLLTSSHR